MNLVACSTLIARVQQDAGIESMGQLFTQAEIIDRLNRAKREFCDEIRAWGGSYFRHRTTIATVNGTSIYALPAECVSLSFVLAFLTPSQFIRCLPFTDDMRPMFATIVGTGWVFGQPVYYQMDDTSGGQQSIEFLPVPTGQFTVQVGYQYIPADFVLTTDTMEDVNGWSEYVVKRAASGCALKARLFDTKSALDVEAAYQLERIKRMASQRDMGAAEIVRDVTRTAPAGYWQEYDS